MTLAEELAHGLDSDAKRIGKAWRAPCPAHDDKNPSLDIATGDRQSIILTCRAGCTQSAIIEALKRRGLWPSTNGKAAGSLTVATLAAHVGLSEKFLRETFRIHDGPRGVLVPYALDDGPAAESRIRTALTGKKRFVWAKGAKPTPYGHWQQRASDDLFLVEGESDTWTLVFHGFSVLGIPGAGFGKVLESEHLEGVRRLYLIREADTGGNAFIANIARRLRDIDFKGEVFVVAMPEGSKDPNSLHKQVGADKFKAAFAELVTQAAPLDLKVQWERRVGQYVETATGIYYAKPSADGAMESLVQLTTFQGQIVADIRKDDGAETTREFEIRAQVGNRVSTFRVPARQFPSLNWVSDELGAKAILTAVTSAEKRTREAIQRFSNPVERQVFVHTGWRQIDGRWAYLHAGGGIDENGLRTDIEVELPTALAHFDLPAPIEGSKLIEAIGLDLQLFKLAPIEIIAPVFCSIYRAVLKPSDFSIFLVGRTGAFKTEEAALAQQHFGRGFNSRNLPAAWSSTANALESLAFVAKEAPCVIDDFAPTGSMVDRQRLHQTADRLIRGAGNAAGRARLGSDLTMRQGKPPRGLILATGEEIPHGHSARGRLFIVEINKGDINAAVLSACQQHAAAGVYVSVMSSFLRWLAPQLDLVLADFGTRYTELRARASHDEGHARTAGIVADLRFGVELFFKFAVEVGAVRPEEAVHHLKNIWAALLKTSSAQAQHVREQDPVERFLTLLNSAITSGAAHLANLTGLHPESPEAWGWRPDRMDTFEPHGSRIGWIEADDLYLDPDASYKAAQAVATDGSSISVTPQTLRRRLAEAGLLASREAGRQTLTIRKSIEGRRREVLHLRASALAPEVEIGE